MNKDICTCSVRQTTGKGFIDFTKGTKYDLDSIKFHDGPAEDKAIKNGLLAKYFKKEPIETNKIDKPGGKKK